MTGKDYSQGGDDREEWDRLWGAKTLRLLPGECKLDLGTLWFPFSSMKIVKVAISDDPLEFAAGVYRETEMCPVCGITTVSYPRVPGHLSLEFERPSNWPYECNPSYCMGVWAHQSCFERCQDTPTGWHSVVRT
jgi:hypothetical protein